MAFEVFHRVTLARLGVDLVSWLSILLERFISLIVEVIPSRLGSSSVLFWAQLSSLSHVPWIIVITFVAPPLSWSDTQIHPHLVSVFGVCVLSSGRMCLWVERWEWQWLGLATGSTILLLIAPRLTYLVLQDLGILTQWILNRTLKRISWIMKDTRGLVLMISCCDHDLAL